MTDTPYVAPTFVNDNSPALNATNMNNLAQAVQKLGVANGGTGKTSITDGAIVVGNGTDAVDELTGTGALYATTNKNPQFGTLPPSCGGTGVTSLSALRAVISVFQVATYTPTDTHSLWIDPRDNTLAFYYVDPQTGVGAWRKIVGVFG